jgi:hypothetical protein
VCPRSERSETHGVSLAAFFTLPTSSPSSSIAELGRVHLDRLAVGRASPTRTPSRLRPGALRAFDAADVTYELWNSHQNEPRDDCGNYPEIAATTVANGRLCYGSLSNQLCVLWPAWTSSGAGPANAS